MSKVILKVKHYVAFIKLVVQELKRPEYATCNKVSAVVDKVDTASARNKFCFVNKT